MLILNKLFEIIISLQILIISTMIPVFITIPFTKNTLQIYEIPITWQIPSIILMVLIFNANVVLTAFTIYLLLGLLILPVFQQGGSIGYLLTPSFGYLLGIYPLIKIINKLNINKTNINIYYLVKSGFLGISIMHIIGIIYCSIQGLFFNNTNLLLYNFSNYTLGKYPFHLLMLAPITLVVKNINKIR